MLNVSFSSLQLCSGTKWSSQAITLLVYGWRIIYLGIWRVEIFFGVEVNKIEFRHIFHRFEKLLTISLSKVKRVFYELSYFGIIFSKFQVADGLLCDSIWLRDPAEQQIISSGKEDQHHVEVLAGWTRFVRWSSQQRCDWSKTFAETTITFLVTSTVLMSH